MKDPENSPMQRCGAKTRSGAPCKNPPVTGKKRCRMHGGAKGSGAQPGNKNAVKHGWYTKEKKKERQEINDLIKGLLDTCTLRS